MKTVRLTMAQALVRFLENQYMEVDGAQHRFVRGVFIIPGHGNVVGLGQALSQEAKHLEIYQGKNEQGMAQAAVAFAREEEWEIRDVDVVSDDHDAAVFTRIPA